MIVKLSNGFKEKWNCSFLDGGEFASGHRPKGRDEASCHASQSYPSVSLIFSKVLFALLKHH
jgi:hypothetical protein